MHWDIKATVSETEPLQRLEQIVEVLFANRGLSDAAVRAAFIKPPRPQLMQPQEVGIVETELVKAVDHIHQAIEAKRPILIYGDYDADGITATAILWEAMYELSQNVYPFIPNRELHGYGLSIKGLTDALEQLPQDKTPLVITVDNGITAFEAAEFLESKGIPLIITDHHQKNSTLPPHLALVHTDQIAGSAVAWFLAKTINPQAADTTLELATIGTITDLLPLHGANRAIVMHGLPLVQHTKRVGLKALYAEAGIDTSLEFTTYHIGFVIGPRLNAMGRLTDAMDSLRLLCTKDGQKATQLSQLLSNTNKARQDLTFEFVDKAHRLLTSPTDSLLIVEHESFHEGVIGLVAGKLAETYHRPAIVVARSEKVSKASARSVKGVNIIELIRSQEALLVNAGGHPQAAGFTIETDKLAEFTTNLTLHANQTIDSNLLTPHLEIDCELERDDLTWDLFKRMEELKPFGIKNPEPVFCLSGVTIVNASAVGRQAKHLRLSLALGNGNVMSAIGFGMGDQLSQVLKAKTVDVAFCLDKNVWNGTTSLQMRVKDFHFSV